MDTFEHDVYFAYEKQIHLTPIWSPDVDGDDDDVRPENLEKWSPRRTPFWVPKWAPKWVQEQPKTGSLFGRFFDQFWATFGGLLGAIWAPRLVRERSG